MPFQNWTPQIDTEVSSFNRRAHEADSNFFMLLNLTHSIRFPVDDNRDQNRRSYESGDDR